MAAGLIRTSARWALDFALPPRCPGCGTIVADVHSFCADCWRQIEFLGDGGCQTCGMPLQATDLGTCAACLGRPPRIARMRAAVAYDDLSRGLAIRLKYGRKVAIARTMARYMAPSSKRGAIAFWCRFRSTVRDCGCADSISPPWWHASCRGG
jgi:predicted amidophosphoribosyltransferase